MPDPATSEYMRTLATSISCDWRAQPRPVHTFSLSVRVRQDVPVGAVLEAQFENPTDSKRPLLASAVVAASGFPEVKNDTVFLISPPVDTVRCKNYEVIVRLYRSKEARELMGTHRQQVQSRMDSALWEAYGDNASERFARQGHLCP